MLSVPVGTSSMYIIPVTMPAGTDTNNNCIRSFKSGFKYQIKLNFIRHANNTQANDLKMYLYL